MCTDTRTNQCVLGRCGRRRGGEGRRWAGDREADAGYLTAVNDSNIHCIHKFHGKSKAGDEVS